MNTDINNYIVRNQQKQWQPLIERGVHYHGISVISLRYDETRQRSTTILLKFEPGSTYPYHNHPGGEEVFVLNGKATFNEVTLSEGDYFYTPVNFKHVVSTKIGCTLLFVVPEEVEILDINKN